MRRAKHWAGSRRRMAVGSMLIVAALTVGQAGMLIAGAAPPVDSPGPASADGVPPVIVDTQSSLEPDVMVANANDPGGVVVNDGSITYTLTVSNQGEADATAVRVTDQLAPGVTFAEGDPGCGEVDGLVTCALGDIGVGASLGVDITAVVDESFCGSIANTAHVSASNESGEATGNNASNEVTNTVGCDEPTSPDLQVSKISGAAGILRDGDDFLYTITVTNVGEEEATGVELVDVLPAGALNVAIPPFPTLGGKGCTVTSSTTGGVPHAEVRCGPVTLGPGESAPVTVKVVVDADVCGPITNVVDVEGANEPAANVGADNHAEASDVIACVPRIRLSKGGPPLAHVGDTITYVFIARNNGPVDLTNIDLTDPMCDTSPTLVDDANGDTTLAVGEAWGFECDHAVTIADGSVVHNEAVVTGDHEGTPVADTDTHDVDVIHPNIDLEQSATPTSGSSGTIIVYTYLVRNTGDTPLFNVSVDDDQLGNVGAIATLAPDASVGFTSQVTLGSSPITNTATAAGADRLGRSVDDEDSVTVTVVAAGAGGNDGDGTGGGSAFTGSDAGPLTRWIAVLGVVGCVLLVSSRGRSRTPRERPTPRA